MTSSTPTREVWSTTPSVSSEVTSPFSPANRRIPVSTFAIPRRVGAVVPTSCITGSSLTLDYTMPRTGSEPSIPNTITSGRSRVIPLSFASDATITTIVTTAIPPTLPPTVVVVTVSTAVAATSGAEAAVASTWPFTWFASRPSIRSTPRTSTPSSPPPTSLERSTVAWLRSEPHDLSLSASPTTDSRTTVPSTTTSRLLDAFPTSRSVTVPTPTASTSTVPTVWYPRRIARTRPSSEHPVSRDLPPPRRS